MRADRLRDNPLPLRLRVPRDLLPLLFPSLLRLCLPSYDLLSSAPSLLLSRSVARTHFYAAFTALSRGSFCRADEEGKKLLRRPFIPQRPQVRELSWNPLVSVIGGAGVRSRGGDQCGERRAVKSRVQNPARVIRYYSRRQ